MTFARPWGQGRAILAYSGVERQLVSVPLPLYWTCLLKQRYYQSALSAEAVGTVLDQPVYVDALLRPKKTKPLDGHTRDARFATPADAITANPKSLE
jgi:predicted amidophosphoribosyltransferase